MGLDPLEHRNTVDPLAEPNMEIVNNSVNESYPSSPRHPAAERIPPTAREECLQTLLGLSNSPTKAGIPTAILLKARIPPKANPIQGRKTTKNTSGDI